MDNYEDEEMVRLVLFRLDFIESLECFNRSKTISDNFIRDCLIKIGIVTYAKAFMGNTGVHKKGRKYCLPKKIIPEEYLWLHEMFLDYRGNFIGHSNFKTMKPKVTYPKENSLETRISTTYTGISYDHWFEIYEELPEESLLIDEAIKLVSILIADIPGSSAYETIG